MGRFESFLRGVEDAPERHCESVRQAVARHRRDARDPPAGCHFDLAAGLRTADWIESRCTFTASAFAGRPFALQPWQLFLVASLFGWRRGDGRRFRHAHLWVPRKQGKSELAAAIGLWMLVADGEGNPLVCATAASEKQARIAPAAAWRMTGSLAEPGAKRNRMTERNPPVVEIEGGRGSFRGLPKDIGGSLDGLSPHCAIVDELHAYATSDTYDAMAEGMGARPNSLLLVISTAGDVDGVGRAQFERARSVLRGETRQDDLFALAYDAPRELEIVDPAAWRLAQPSLGVTVGEDYLASRAADAAATGNEETFRRKQLNQWPLRGGGADDLWLRADDWDACAEAGLRPEQGARVWLGFGFAAAERRLASATVWRRGPDWCLSARRHASDADALDWALSLAAQRRLECALDPVRSAPLMRALERRGVERVAVERGTRSLALPMRALADLAADRGLRHDVPPELRAQFVGTRQRLLPDGLARPEDGAPEAPVAALNALAAALAADGGDGPTAADIPDWDAL